MNVKEESDPHRSAAPSVVGIVGAGGIAQAHAAAWRYLGVEAWVYSVDDRAPALAAEYGLHVASSLQDLLGRADVIDVCTPTTTHMQIVRAAADAGRHVICEKPLGLDPLEVQQMIDHCRDRGVRFLPGQVVRFFPEYEAAAAKVREGALGDLAVVRLMRRTRQPGALWFHDEELSGGVLVDQLIHDFDFARWIGGEVESVFAALTGVPGQSLVAQIALQHSSGQLTQIFGGWTTSGAPFRTSYRIAGTGGLLTHDSADTAPLQWGEPHEGSTAKSHGAPLPSASGPTPFAAEMDEFLGAIRSGTDARVTAEDSLAALRIALAARQSAREGRPVSPAEMSIA